MGHYDEQRERLYRENDKIYRMIEEKFKASPNNGGNNIAEDTGNCRHASKTKRTAKAPKVDS